MGTTTTPRGLLIRETRTAFRTVYRAFVARRSVVGVFETAADAEAAGLAELARLHRSLAR